jgi:hypothetical protein
MGTYCPKHVESDRQINIFEKISASIWFTIHKLTQDARETKQNKLLLHLVGVPHYFTYIDDARLKTKKKRVL